MTMSVKATAESVQLVAECDAIKTQIKSLQTTRIGRPNQEWKMYDREINRLWGQFYKKQDRIAKIDRWGISTSEQKQLKLEALASNTTFVTIHRDKSLGSTGYTKVGWSKSLEQFVKVELTVYSDFMRNVQGCASLAGKRELYGFSIISHEEADELLKAGCKAEVNFISHDEKVMPITATAESLKR